jgi:hypothetical protein
MDIRCFKSFGDTPDGFGEEVIKKLHYAVGAEYLYQRFLCDAFGYFHESPVKGARQFSPSEQVSNTT